MILAVVIMTPISLIAQETKPQVEAINDIQMLESLMGKIDTLRNIADAMAKEKYYQCLKAFGDTSFCKCLADDLPIRASFADYIAIIISSKDELNYSSLKKEDKELIDITCSVREACINKRK